VSEIKTDIREMRGDIKQSNHDHNSSILDLHKSKHTQTIAIIGVLTTIIAIAVGVLIAFLK
jgi:t-SNARE complex subunit (syntaxin)